MPIILPYKGIQPKIHPDAFIAQGVAITGDTEVGAGANIWFNVSMRGDVNYIRIGAGTNIQDNTVCHVTYKKFPLIIGENVTVGHGAILHGCVIEDASFIGMGAIVMDGAVVESGAMVAAGAQVTPGKRVKSGKLWAGRPAKYMRDMTQEEKDYILWSAEHYMRVAAAYKPEAVE